MRVAFFQFFPPTLWTPGGGEVQLAKTKEALERRGIEVILFDPWSRRKDFDLLHVFGSSYELSSFVEAAKGLGLPIVVSAIAFSAKPAWQWRLWRLLDPLVPVPTIYRLRQRIYSRADIIIAASWLEAEQLMQGFFIHPNKVRIVPHGIESDRFLNPDPSPFVERYGLKDFILQVSRIYRYKGQARLIRALKGTGLKVVFIGPLDPTDPEGTQEFLRLVEKNNDFVHYLGTLPHDDPLLVSAYAAARVHVLPSTIIESPGLVSLEAMAAGATVVSGYYPTLYDYVGELIYYCDPNSEESIRRAVLEAYEKGPKPGAREFVLSNFSWDKVAERLERVYEEVLR
jgi:glycosyltransferase involved in cell wall biosynthesis